MARSPTANFTGSTFLKTVAGTYVNASAVKLLSPAGNMQTNLTLADDTIVLIEGPVDQVAAALGVLTLLVPGLEGPRPEQTKRDEVLAEMEAVRHGTAKPPKPRGVTNEDDHGEPGGP